MICSRSRARRLRDRLRRCSLLHGSGLRRRLLLVVLRVSRLRLPARLLLVALLELVPLLPLLVLVLLLLLLLL